MHPALYVRDLSGLNKAVVTLLSKSPGPLPQGELLRRLGSAAPSQSTLSRALQVLTEAGITFKSGSTKAAAFGLTKEARWFETPVFRRPKIQYEPSRIGDYVPNETKWLRRDHAESMRDSAGPSSTFGAESYSREIAERFLIEMSWASSALEGNTYSLLETEILIKYAERADGRSAEEATMILNHKDAIGWMLDNLTEAPLDIHSAQRLHALLMRGLVRPENLGAARSHAVGITNSAYQPSEDRFELISGLSELLYKASQVQDPFEASMLVLCGTSYLQAFADGNKRTGRLLSSLPLLKAGLPPISFIGVDKQSYHAGMLSWYELGNPDWVASAIAEGYSVSAPEYKVSNLTRRVVRSVEIRERELVNESVRTFRQAIVDGQAIEPADHASAAFGRLSVDDRKILTESFVSIMESMTEATGSAFRVDQDLTEAYLAAVASRGYP